VSASTIADSGLAAASGHARRRQRLMLLAVAAPPILYLVVLYVAPLGAMLIYSLGRPVGVDAEITGDLDQYGRIFGTPAVLELLGRSLRTAAIVTAACVGLAFPVAYILARIVPRRYQWSLLLLLLIPAWSSFIVRTYSWLLILGNEGLVNSGLGSVGIEPQTQLVFNQFAVIVTLIGINLPWAVLPMYVAIEKIQPSLFEAGAVLGASRLYLLRRVVLPLALPGVVAAVLFVFVPAISTFAVPEILGGTSGTLYASLVSDSFQAFNWPFGAALSTVMLAVTLLIVALSAKLVRFDEIWTRQ
jgi:spermidine/putrescine transport system permease protein